MRRGGKRFLTVLALAVSLLASGEAARMPKATTRVMAKMTPSPRKPGGGSLGCDGGPLPAGEGPLGASFEKERR